MEGSRGYGGGAGKGEDRIKYIKFRLETPVYIFFPSGKEGKEGVRGKKKGFRGEILCK